METGQKNLKGYDFTLDNILRRLVIEMGAQNQGEVINELLKEEAVARGWPLPEEE